MKCRKRVLLILIALNLCFIWGNSALKPEISNAISDKVVELFGGAADGTAGNEDGMATWYVRKLAHMLEFAALGALITLYALAGKKPGSVWTAIALPGVLTALTDETVQIFSGRTSTVKDVWIDCLGFAIGILIICAVRALKRKQTCKKTN